MAEVHLPRITAHNESARATALVEVIRRLRLEPEIEMLGTSHRHDTAVVAVLFRCLGFVPWERLPESAL